MIEVPTMNPIGMATDRQREVARAVIVGGYKGAAERLGLSIGTVKTTMYRLYNLIGYPPNYPNGGPNMIGMVGYLMALYDTAK